MDIVGKTLGNILGKKRQIRSGGKEIIYKKTKNGYIERERIKCPSCGKIMYVGEEDEDDRICWKCADKLAKK